MYSTSDDAVSREINPRFAVQSRQPQLVFRNHYEKAGRAFSARPVVVIVNPLIASEMA